MLFVNVITIFGYLLSTAIMFKPSYIGITISLLILVFETSFIMIWKYSANNYQMSFPVVFAMLVSVGVMLVWIVYIVLEVVLDDEEPESFKSISILITVAYFVILIGALLFMEYKSHLGSMTTLSCSFWILFGMTWLILIAVGAAQVAYGDYGLSGIVWISLCVYIILNMLLYAYRRIIDVVFSLLFVAAGVVLLVFAETDDQSFQGISVLYFGMFILSFGAFIQEYIQNKLKKRKTIFMSSPQVFPML
jgi:hypothetical protein